MQFPAIPQVMPRTGTARMAAIAGTALTTVAIAAFVMWPRPHSLTDPSVASAPPSSVRGDLAGPNRTEEGERLRQLDAARAAATAQRQSQSYTPAMGGFISNEPGDPGPQPARPTVRLEETPPAAPAPVPAPAASTAAPPSRPPTDAEIKRKEEAIAALFAGWKGKDGAVNVYEDGGPRRGQARLASAGSVTPAGQMLQTASPPAAPAAQRRKRVLMDAGTGVYGVIVTGGNTDQGSPTIIAQVLSGPISGRRLLGSFTRQGSNNQPGSLLGLRFNAITIDGKLVPTDAFAVAPDTMDSAVASRIDPHTVERIVLPAAAAFVQGLGQALITSGSTVAAGPYGGFSSFRNFSPEQILGIGAGAAGASASQMLRKQAPRERTVFINAGAEVGIMFRTPLEVDD